MVENTQERTSIYSDISRANARYLAESVGGFRRFGEKVGLAEAQVSQLLGKNPRRNIGVKIARRIEEAFEKPLGWIDQRHEEAGLAELSEAAMNELLSTELGILRDQVAKVSACLRATATANEVDKKNLIHLALSILEE
ncbi:hypothetical protein [Undibacterium pigrum]|uniref:Uncharacterized protein n=1 Tax=Undibacterium pigrum TaxID=401470 RepID=A0A318J6S1_9BURK|nr:hypothetical protein [Undibacterium pigrum]PXX42038.1 hypothetical protein DFR42_106217 [Undibacterium pigrum]